MKKSTILFLRFFKEFIALEKKREANPFYLRVHSEWLPLTFDGDSDVLSPPNIQRAGYYSDFSKEDYDQELELLNKKFEKFPIENIIDSIKDNHEIMSEFRKLVDEYEELNKKNTERFASVMKEIDEFRNNDKLKSLKID